MAEDIASYIMVVDKQHLHYLAQIRHWHNVKMAKDENMVWLKDITEEQVASVALNSIPYKTVFENRGGLLFLPCNYVPERKMPALLWTPLQKAIPVTLPTENLNYFGLREKVNIQLTRCNIERASQCIMVHADILGQYLETSPAIRFKNLGWVIVNNNQCLVMGSPLLPVPGESFWVDKNFIIPSGFELRLFYDEVNALINPGNDSWVVWNKDATWYSINKQMIKQLSLGSYRSSFNKWQGL